MSNRIFKNTLLIASMSIALLACSEKDDKDLTTNYTNNAKTTANFNSNVTYGTMTDQEGNVYKTVTIGTQIWMAENLRTIKYNDGSSISNVLLDSVWFAYNNGAYCNYSNTMNLDTILTYGRLYNWYAVNSGKLAPKGWHIPTSDEIDNLINFLGDDSIAGYKLKESGNSHWLSSKNLSSNESGFTALPSGGRVKYGVYDGMGYRGNWWSSKEEGSGAINFFINEDKKVRGTSFNKNYGFSVRCIKD